MALNHTKIINAKPKEKAYKLADEKGLFLYVTTKEILPTGNRNWRRSDFDYWRYS